ncbi:MAG: hypothetical protein VX550_05150 [Bacteroidota bacterium]|nr:hypothetical protein [Bacteroidota bacterium]
MLHRFFETTQPIHYALYSGLVIVAGFTSVFWFEQLSFQTVTTVLGLVFVLLLTQFILIKNELTQNSSYAFMSMSVLLCLLFPNVFSDWLWLANLLIFMSLRRLLSMRTRHSILAKIFDASFWITIASLIEPKFCLFFLPVFVGVFLWARNNYRFWVIPFLGITTVLIISWVIQLYFNIDLLPRLILSSSYEFAGSYVLQLHWVSILLLSFIVAGIILYVGSIISVIHKTRAKYSVLFFYSLVSAIIFLWLDKNQTASQLLLFLPTVLFLNYIFTSSSNRVLKIILVLIPIAILAVRTIFIL